MSRQLWNLVSYVLIPVVFGYVSLLLTGFSFGLINNVFHLPYVLNLIRLPEFRDDAFYATLNNFTSIVWPILRAVTTEANVEQVFSVANLASRIAAFAGLASLARSAGLDRPLEVLLAMMVLTLTPLLQMFSIVGGHGMFIHYFTHSEVTWVFVFLSVGFLYADRIVLAYMMMGIAFSVNAFIGIWLFGMNTLVLFAVKRPFSVATFLKALAGFALFALPAALWIFFAVSGKHEAVDFSYIDYVRSYYPKHFLIEAIEWKSMLKHLLLVSAGLLAARHLPQSRFWVALQLSALLLVIVGVPLPYLFDNRFIFNLHLIRAAGIGQALATVLIALAGVRLLLNREALAMRVIGAVVLLSLAILEIRIIGMAVLLTSMLAALPGGGFAARFDRWGIFRWIEAPRKLLAGLCVLLFALALTDFFWQHRLASIQGLKLTVSLGVFALLAFGQYRRTAVGWSLAFLLFCYTAAFCWHQVRSIEENQRFQRTLPVNQSWAELTSWIRSSRLHGPFLLPMDDHDHVDYFQLQSRRKVWVDWKQGAAVMWSPAFYWQWSTRLREVSALRTPGEMVSYARARGIRYVVLHASVAGVPASCRLLKRTPNYVLYEVL
ncbi:hypothetical protein FGF66_05745 [Chlorobaculum thiosulfatiphilum]|uniref:YfhO family protein n=2 Tax=Chlorobaculum thiosulfatiphilum TaxID=115852 RepID=A0A5C4S6M1_CHLTI|nr:hypothetical protein FGF66_05745 [Chlorobaculum thiosulfatiphilum]